MKISVIIPVHNEQESIVPLINYIRKNGGDRICEIIVSDAASTDNTFSMATVAGAKALLAPVQGRAYQMNHASDYASGDILYFIHADTYPPVTFVEDILHSIQDGYEFGRFRTRFNSKKQLLKLNAFFTRFDWFMCYGGDQTLFVAASLFKRIGGYKNELLIMEEYDFVQRAKAVARYKIFNDVTLVSIRKYQANSWLRVQRANYTMIRLFKKGIDQSEMIKTYKQLLTDIK